MIRLDEAGTRALSLITAQNGASVTVGFSDYTIATGAYVDSAPTCTTISSATTTSICATPASGAIRDIDYVNIKNTFAGSHTMTLQITSGSGGPFVQKTFTLLQDESITFTHGGGYSGFTAAAGIKSGGVSAPGSSTDNAFVRWDGTSGTAIQNSSATLDDNGRPTFPTTVGVGAATPSTSGSGVTFPASQSASTDANTLDDYEEGTWTPVDASGAALSYTGAAGTYEKIGRQVCQRCTYTYPATVDGSNNFTGGLPFTTANADEARQGFLCFTDEATAFQLVPENNNTIFNIRGVAGAAITNATLSTNTVRGTVLTHI